MSDVERICEENHNRVKWAEEYSDMREPVLQFPSRKERQKAREKQQILRTATIACAMASGMGAAFAGIGVAEWNMAALITGAIIVVVFMISGIICETKAEEAEDDV